MTEKPGHIEKGGMIPVDEAIRIVLDSAELLPEMPILLQGAKGNVLAESVYADIDFPDFNRAMMDGYALMAASSGEGKILTVDAVVSAGEFYSKTIPEGHAVKIMTGAPVPDSVDTVIEKELTSDASENSITLNAKVDSGRNIAFRGEEVKKGSLLLEKGTVIDAPVASVLAMAGKGLTNVYRIPQVGILPTGTELVDPWLIPGPGQIRDSNTYGLNAQCLSWGAVPLRLGKTGDDPGKLKEAIESGLRYDILVITGGVSAGDYDLVPDILKELGVEIIFHRVAQKPAKPMLFGRRGKSYVAGLPGNPVAAYLGFELYIGPLIRRIAGEENFKTEWFDGTAAGEFKVKSDRTLFLPSKVKYEDKTWKAMPVESRGSADIFSVAGTNAFVRFEKGRYSVKAGEEVRFFFRRGFQYGAKR